MEHTELDMDIPSVSRGDDAGAEPKVLPNEILLSIFRLLDYKDLISAEQVCWQWKTVIETCFAKEKRLSLSLLPKDYSHSLDQMKRYGSSVRTLKFVLDLESEYANLNWAEEIADRFPNLVAVELSCFPNLPAGLKCNSSEKCCRHRNDTSNLHSCCFSEYGWMRFALVLKEIIKIQEKLCSQGNLFPSPDASVLFSTCRSLHTLTMTGPIRCTETACFVKFCKECVTLRKLVLDCSCMRREIVAQIQHCSLLEELSLYSCLNVDDSLLIEISKGCPNLRSVSLVQLLVTSDEGLKCFARCRNLNSFVTDNKKMTDETLVELGKCVNLRELTLNGCPLVSDQGCGAVLSHCPQLQSLDVYCCDGVSNATVDLAIEAVECRRNGLTLELMVEGTKITPQQYENCHPLLRLKN